MAEGLRLAAICFGLVLGAGCVTAPTSSSLNSDYDKEVALLTENVKRALHAHVQQPSQKAEFEIGYQYFALASLTGDFDQYKEAEFFLKSSQTPAPEHAFSSAYLDYRLHRFRSAEAKLKGVQGKIRDEHLAYRAQKLSADICLQLGEKNCHVLEPPAPQKTAWQDLAAEANLRFTQGDFRKADHLYEKAQHLLDEKSDVLHIKRHRAWLELQRGIINLEYHRFEKSLEHLRKADTIYSGYWLIEEHIAEVLTNLGRADEAMAIYKRVIKNTDNPEYLAAYANLVTDRNEKEKIWSKAEKQYEERMKLFPEAAAGHFLEFLLENPNKRAHALQLAEEDHSRRPNSKAKLSLAKAYLANSNCEKSIMLLETIRAGQDLRVPEFYATGVDAATQCKNPTLLSRLKSEYESLLK